ncbi:MAG TPA: DUF2244 domain-containing protein [Microvirga sp.]|jgi:uncharacterized membrane protein|nr:DUF2244 domain-containing protein [Microvirga sp.]
MQDGSKDSAEAFEQPVFTAVIRPHRSLGPEAFRTVMTLCCLATLVASIPFVVLGFWPVAGFFGLDMLALYIAFRVNFRRGDAFEELVLTPFQLLVRRVSHRGKREEFRFNPLWTRLDREHDEDFGLQRLSLISRGQTLPIARELSPPERESFADELGRALSDVKRGY